MSRAAWEVVQGECLAMLRSMADDSVDAVITDPPYSSGGFSRDDKNKAPGDNTSRTGLRPSTHLRRRQPRPAQLPGLVRHVDDGMREGVEPGGYFMAFTDWRQLPVMTDAVQAGGVVWRGVVAWDKGRGARAPHKGYFKHQCEYVVWGTKGPAVMLEHDGPFDGCISVPVRQADKHHMTGKPTELMRALVRPVVPGGLVLDPFAGSGSTGVAALLEGRRFLGIEREADYVRIACDRLAALDGGLLAAQQAPCQASFEGVEA